MWTCGGAAVGGCVSERDACKGGGVSFGFVYYCASSSLSMLPCSGPISEELCVRVVHGQLKEGLLGELCRAHAASMGRKNFFACGGH